MLNRNLGRVVIHIGMVMIPLSFVMFLGTHAFADNVGALPAAEDISSKMVASAQMLRLLDTWVFVWGAKMIAGFFFMGALWSFKEQRVGHGVICLSCAAACAFTPALVRNLFDTAGGKGVFSQSSLKELNVCAIQKQLKDSGERFHA